jgi:hypothetical protein
LNAIKFIFFGNGFRLLGVHKYQGTPPSAQPLAFTPVKFVVRRILNYDFHEHLINLVRGKGSIRTVTEFAERRVGRNLLNGL